MLRKKNGVTQNNFYDSKYEKVPKDINSSKKEKIKQSNNKNTENKSIFNDNDNKISKQIEIFATLKGKENITNSKNKSLIFIKIDSQSSISSLCIKIRESLYKFPEYQNLKGLEVVNLTKKIDKKNKEKKLQINELVGDVLRNGDIIFFELKSDEIWIKINICMINASNKIRQKLYLSMDTKINKNISFKELVYIHLKFAINCWLEKVPNVNSYHYIVTGLNISTIRNSKEENNMMVDHSKVVGEIFGFEDCIKLNIKFNTLEFLFFQKLKHIKRPSSDKMTSEKKEQWEEYKGMKFKEFLNNKNFVNEKIIFLLILIN